jgi:ferredoxin
MVTNGLEFLAYPINVPGPYYVTRRCIGCGICAAIAPDNFREDTDWDSAESFCYVYAQPNAARQEENCAEALNTCPVNAIGSNGAATIPGRKP